MAILLLLTPGAANGALVFVGSNADTCDYTSLAFAIAFADSGDALIVEGKTWTHISGVNFNLFDKSLTISGGYDADCTGTATGQPAVLQGLGSDAVLEIDSDAPASVTMNDLVIQGGDGDVGGGVAISGDVTVVMADVTIQGNDALSGGGISLDGSNGARLTLGAGTVIEDNVADNLGGGIHCFAGADLAISNSVDLYGNQATSGGGLAAEGCDVEMTLGFTHQIFIQDNTAQEFGGGIFLTGGALLTGDGGTFASITIDGNEAVHGGGGVAVLGSGSSARLTRARVDYNFANAGAAIYVDSGSFRFDASTSGPCLIGECNTSVFNAFGGGADGGVFFVTGGGELRMQATALVGNHGFPAIGTIQNASTVTLEGVWVVGNDAKSSGSGRGFVVDAGSSVTLRGVTFADQVNMGRLFDGSGSIDADSIIAAGVPSDLFETTLDWDLYCAVLTEDLPGGPFPQASNLVVTPDPGFVDRAAPDVHLRPDSPAIDICGALPLGIDQDSEIRDQGLGWDAGSDETETPIFADGFESGDMSAWSTVVESGSLS